MGAHRGGGARVGRPPPPPQKKRSSLAILGAFLLRFSYFWGPFHHVGAFFATFTSWWGPFLERAPPPYENFCGLPGLQGGFESMLLGNFLCDHNLVSSGHVLLRFCLKNDKNNDKL